MRQNLYYLDKLNYLKEIYNTDQISLKENSIIINDYEYPIHDDVIVMDGNSYEKDKIRTIESFGSEWSEFNEITPEHFEEFELYFDLLDINKLENKKVIDVGCGIGRWSKILIDKIKIDKLVLLDLSESIFVARNFFRENDNVIFIKQDLEKINFKNNIFDLLICLGVLHHLPQRETKILQTLSRISFSSLFYLYYKLDNVSKTYKVFFFLADKIRKVLSKSKYDKLNVLISYILTIFFYLPFVFISKLIKKIGFDNSKLPLSFYENASFFRIRQDAYDRFFTNIEYRTSKKEIKKIYGKYFSNIKISNLKPYWHFFCEKN